MLRSLILLLAVFLAGCVAYPEYDYYDGRPGYSAADGGDYYYDRYDESYSGDYGYAPDYIRYPAYYSMLWPIYRSYYDPFWCPSYYYGVTYYPRHYFNFGLNYYGPSWYFHSYSPYNLSYWDNYYHWNGWHHNYYGSNYARRDWGRNSSGRHDHPRFGSARNEAERLARQLGEAPNAIPGRFEGSAASSARGESGPQSRVRDSRFGNSETGQQGGESALQSRARDSRFGNSEAPQTRSESDLQSRARDPRFSDSKAPQPRDAYLRGESDGRYSRPPGQESRDRFGNRDAIDSSSPLPTSRNHNSVIRRGDPSLTHRKDAERDYRSTAPSRSVYSEPSRRAPLESSSYAPRNRDSYDQVRAPVQRSTIEGERSHEPLRRDYAVPRSRDSSSERSYSGPQWNESRGVRAAPERSYAAPQRGYSEPSRSSYTAPERSYSAPQQRSYSDSSRSYSAPPSSYSAPQRSASPPPARSDSDSSSRTESRIRGRDIDD